MSKVYRTLDLRIDSTSIVVGLVSRRRVSIDLWAQARDSADVSPHTLRLDRIREGIEIEVLYQLKGGQRA